MMQNLLSTEIQKEGLAMVEKELYELVKAKSGLVKKFYSLETLTDPQAKRLFSEEEEIKVLVSYQQTVTAFITILQEENQQIREAAKAWNDAYLQKAKENEELTDTFLSTLHGLRKAS